jgi:hypothetical protein
MSQPTPAQRKRLAMFGGVQQFQFLLRARAAHNLAAAVNGTDPNPKVTKALTDLFALTESLVPGVSVTYAAELLHTSQPTVRSLVASGYLIDLHTKPMTISARSLATFLEGSSSWEPSQFQHLAQRLIEIYNRRNAQNVSPAGGTSAGARALLDHTTDHILQREAKITGRDGTETRLADDDDSNPERFC